MRKRTKIFMIAALSAATVALSSDVLALSIQAATPQLVYICSQQPCQNSQEFEVFDANGSPIYSVGEFGGDAVFGDNRSVFPPNSVFHPSLVESYTTPATYASQHKTSASCVAPETWIAPTGIYVCRNGSFALLLSLK